MKSRVIEKYILSHDIGTTGNKASLYDTNGTLLATTYKSYETYYPHPDWVEQDPQQWWEAICSSTREVITKAKISNEQIAGISFSGQMMTLIPMSREGEIMLPRVMIWADSRSVEEGAFVEQQVGWQNFYHITGAGMPIPLYAIAKVLWIKNHLPDVYRDAYKLLGVKDVIIQRMTGEFCTDFSDASNTGLYDLENKCWSTEILQKVGLDLKKLPEVINNSTDIVGYVNEATAEATGLKAGTPVVIGGGDVPCAALGAGIIQEGNAYNCIGSASWFAVATKAPMIDDRLRPFTLCHVVPGMFVAQLATFSAGVAHQWVTENLCDYERIEAEKTGRSVYEIFDKKAASSPAGSNGLMFLPNMRPGGAPHNNLDDRGAFIGLKLSNTKNDLLRSVLEGVSFNIRLMCEAIESNIGKKFDEVVFIGGGAKSEVWGEIQASIMAKRFVTLEMQQEANSLGAALIAGVGLGLFENFEDAAKKFIRVRRVFEPTEKDVGVYDKLFEIFSDVYDALSPINTKLKAIITDNPY